MLSSSQRWFKWLIVLLVLLGCVLRFHHLERKSLWVDELFTLAMAQYHPLSPEAGKPWYRSISVFEIADGDTFLTAKAAEQSPPLQDLIEKATVQWLGPTELAARLPGAIASCLLLAWVAWFAAHTRDPWERRVLGWTLLLLTFSPVLVVFAHDGRAYSLGAALMGMGGLLWLFRWRRGWRHVDAPGWGEIGLFCLACYTHYNAAACVAMLLSADAVVATIRRSWMTWRRLLVLGCVFVPWLVVNAHTIVFTAGGGVAWGNSQTTPYALFTVRDAVAAAHLPWLVLVALTSWYFFARRSFQGREIVLSPNGKALLFLLSFLVLYIVVVGKITATAGMISPRYYIFMVPFAAVAFGMVLAELQRRWVIGVFVALVVALAWRDLYRPTLTPYEQFREMTQAAVEGVDEETLFIFPWRPNRDMYRIYLERFLGRDMRERMIAVSSSDDVPVVCERVRAAKHVVVLSHNAGRQRIDEVYAACGGRWPSRLQQQFFLTFTEHWRTEMPGLDMMRRESVGEAKK